MEKTCQGGAPVDGREDRREKWMRGSPAASESAEDTCREAELRRRIAWWLADAFVGDQREIEEGFWGFL
jgi:hypothetical protein